MTENTADSETPIELLGRVTEALTSRRDFLGTTAKVGAGGALLSADAGTAAAGGSGMDDKDDEDDNGDDGEMSAEDMGGVDIDGDGDIDDLDILNYALTLEHLEATYYSEFLEEYSEKEVERSEAARVFADPSSRFSTCQKVEEVRDHEEAHVEALTQTIKDLGGEPVEPAEYEFPYESIEEFFTLSATIEAVGVSAYAGAAPLIENDDLIPPALSIHSVEARHTSYFNVLNTTNPFPEAFDEPRSMEEVLEIASQFIVGMGDGDSEDEDEEEFSADLSGENEVPSVDTDAEGEATFTLADHDDGPHLHYELFVEEIENVTQAHIHVGAADENGDVVAFLFEAEDGVDVGDSERLAKGSLTADDLVGPLEGMDLAALAEEMRAGNTYANVHTTQNPAGEIRGQIESE